MEKRKQELIDDIESDGLVGPWSWSSQLDHVSTIVAYGILRRNDKPSNYSKIASGILVYIGKQALYIARNGLTVVDNTETVETDPPLNFELGLAANRMAKILGQLQSVDILVPNEVGNLAIIRNSEYAGYIDFRTGQIELQEAEEDNDRSD